MLKNLLPSSKKKEAPTVSAGGRKMFADPGQPTRPLLQADVDQMYEPLPSFASHLPWVEYLEDEQAILLSDGISVGAAFDVGTIPTEGRGEAWLEEVRDSIEDALQDSFEEKAVSPWVVQFFCQDTDDFREYLEALENHIKPEIRETEFTQRFLKQTRRHMQSIAKEGGLFKDEMVTKTPWRGTIRKVRIVVYRWIPSGENAGLYDLGPLEALNDACARLTAALAGAGIPISRMSKRQFHRWMLPWFNPAPDADTPQQFYDLVDQSYAEPPPAGALPLPDDDLGESLLFSQPTSLPGLGWVFDGQFHQVVTVERLRRHPGPGHFTGEVRRGDAINALFDLMPDGAVLAITMLVTPQDVLEQHLAQLSKKSIGENIESELTSRDCATARSYLGERHKLYRSNVAIFIKGHSKEELRRRHRTVTNALQQAGLEPVAEADEVAPCSSYLRWLPMAFNPLDDRHDWYSRFMFVQHIAGLVPLYGRARGTGTPGLTFFNRGGEPLCFDPLSKHDRQANGHLLLLGPTGAGKSATLSKLMAEVMAIIRPRMFVIEAGNSFGLVADDFARFGISVNRISIKPGGLRQGQGDGPQFSLNPFSEAWKLLELDAVHLDESEIEDDDVDVPVDDEDEQRDLMGEMEIAARLMITGGEPKEIEAMTRADRSMVREAIYAAAKVTHAQGKQTLPEDIKAELLKLSHDEARPPRRRERASDMAEAMSLFCQGFEGELFNRPSDPWPDADFTLVDLATFAREGYEGQMAITYISLLNRANNIAEREQHSGRIGVVLTDEGHITTTNPLVAPYAVKVTKMWRKLGFWYWVATQNLADFPDISEKLLNMIEWWLCLTMPPAEVEEIARFKRLTDAQKQLLLSATKEPRKYTEGVVLSKKVEALFRVVPPSLYLALGMTENEEKAERRELMHEHGITEVEAAYLVAQKIDQARGIISEHEALA
ncbi:conjugative transfer ATPase [Pseudomonas lopnurensis]|uniref:conjugative transfer ATPase n=1 Tax=Pseudomonas lopnurensis TaxID=1477517 RepID=UPI0028AE4D3E|nr:conjugative transfer ATPase [Pseudomonas lopnurensis]